MSSKARGLADLGNAYDDGALSNRNLIINGAMQVAQRGTSVTSNGSGYLVVDRFKHFFGSGGTETTLDVTQDSDAPDGFDKSLKLAVNTIGDTSPVTTSHGIEGQNLAGLGTGTTNAKPITLSFFVKSNVVGTYAVEFKASNETELYRYVGNYTVNASGVWEAKQIVVLPLTEMSVSSTNDVGLAIEFWLNDSNGQFSGDNTALANWADESTMGVDSRAAGQTATIGDSASDFWQITGVQLEVGDTATPFEHRSFGQELARCQRYYYEKQQYGRRGGGLFTQNVNRNQGRLYLPQPMRSPPSFTATRDLGDGTWDSAVISAENGYTEAINREYVDVEVNVNIDDGGGNGGTWVFTFTFDAEL